MKRGRESGRERGREGKKKKRFHNTFTLCLNYWEKIEQIQQILFWDCLKICIIMNDTSKKTISSTEKHAFPFGQYFGGFKGYSLSCLWLGTSQSAWQWPLVLGEVHAEEHTSQIIFQKHALVFIYKALRHYKLISMFIHFLFPLKCNPNIARFHLNHINFTMCLLYKEMWLGMVTYSHKPCKKLNF